MKSWDLVHSEKPRTQGPDTREAILQLVWVSLSLEHVSWRVVKMGKLIGNAWSSVVTWGRNPLDR